MAGHVITLHRGALKKPVDYKDGERPTSCETGVFTKSSVRPFLFFKEVREVREVKQEN